VLAWATGHKGRGLCVRSVSARGHQDSNLTLPPEDRSVAMPPSAERHDKLHLYKLHQNLCSLLNAVTLKSCQRLTAYKGEQTY
jgi:hypothetical protein